ncbi:MAG: DUF3019 domain-containing protein [Methylococcaceae bacterium]|nr:DUF3019 domain-containing protein [Methylococcaceae bacterium]
MKKQTSLIKQFRLLLSLIVFFCQTPSPLAEPSNSKQGSTPWKLWAKPRICVLPSKHRLCKMETDIFWRGKNEDDICLLSSQDNAILQCWTNASAGQVVQEIYSDKQITYWLTREGENKVLVKTIIHIVNFPQRRVRRRRRHVWSLL